jgi:hypothetical protein
MDTARPAPPTRRSVKRVSWPDASTATVDCPAQPQFSGLVQVKLFWADEESWRCGRRLCPLLLANHFGTSNDYDDDYDFWSAGTPSALAAASAAAPASPPATPTAARASSPPRAAGPIMQFDNSQLPTTEAEVMAELGAHGVQVESCLLRPPTCFLSLRVLNVAYQKSVFIRSTANGWASHTDTHATFGSCVSATTERFFATLSVPSYSAGTKLEFAVCYKAGTQEFWDNNSGRNYIITI